MEENSSSPVKKTGNFANNRRRLIWISIAIMVTAVAILWIGKQIQIGNLRSESEKEHERIESEARRAVINSHEQHLRLLAKPFTWAVRTEMINNNLSQVNQYTNDMIKEKNISSIMIIDAAGKIITSTNKKWEGKDFAIVGKRLQLQSDTTIIENIKDSILVMSSPVMGFNSRLGTIVLNYNLPKIEFTSAK
jgi:hypothetical protein